MKDITLPSKNIKGPSHSTCVPTAAGLCAVKALLPVMKSPIPRPIGDGEGEHVGVKNTDRRGVTCAHTAGESGRRAVEEPAITSAPLTLPPKGTRSLVGSRAATTTQGSSVESVISDCNLCDANLGFGVSGTWGVTTETAVAESDASAEFNCATVVPTTKGNESAGTQ